MTNEVQEFIEANSELLHYTHYQFMERFALLPYYAACDVVSIPSYYDGLPNVMMEAGGLGVPFIASGVAGMADFLEDGQHGFLFKPGNMEQCREAIRKMFALTTTDLKQMGLNCQEMVKSQLDYKLETKRYAQVFRETLPEA